MHCSVKFTVTLIIQSARAHLFYPTRVGDPVTSLTLDHVTLILYFLNRRMLYNFQKSFKGVVNPSNCANWPTFAPFELLRTCWKGGLLVSVRHQELPMIPKSYWQRGRPHFCPIFYNERIKRFSSSLRRNHFRLRICLSSVRPGCL